MSVWFKHNALSVLVTIAISSLAAAIVIATAPLDNKPSFADLPEWLSGAGNLITGFAAAFAAWQGVRSLNAWRQEATGRRRIEVAEDVLASFYQLREIIFDARSPIVRASEKYPEVGTEADHSADANYAPWRRLVRHLPFITEFRAKRHRFAAVFGQHSTPPFDSVMQVIYEIRGAVEMLLDNEKVSLRDPDYALYEQMRRTAFRISGKDEISKQVNAAVQDIEDLCRPFIEDASNP